MTDTPIPTKLFQVWFHMGRAGWDIPFDMYPDADTALDDIEGSMYGADAPTAWRIYMVEHDPDTNEPERITNVTADVIAERVKLLWERGDTIPAWLGGDPEDFDYDAQRADDWCSEQRIEAGL
jgi:hypothetical protein